MKLGSSLLAIAAAALLAGVASLSQVSSANAATTPVSHSSYALNRAADTPQKIAAAPDISNFFTFQQTGFGGFSATGQCIQGAVYSADFDPVASVHNNCEYHIYLQYSNMPAFCINPHSSRSDIGSQYRNPISIQVGPATTDC